MAKRKSQHDASPVIFTDRNLGSGIVPNAIKAAGYQVIVHDDQFAQDTTDVQIFSEINGKGWILISNDSNITRNVAELEALIAANIHAFFVRITNPTGPKLASAIVSALPVISEIVNRRSPPSFGFIRLDGKIDSLLGYDQMVQRVQEIRDRLPIAGK